MDSSTHVRPNPFLNNTLNSLCIACNRKLENRQSVSINENLPHIQPAISLFEGLKLLSDFSKFSIEQVPQRACRVCFGNTSGFLRFHKICSTAISNIEAYILLQEDTKQNDISVADNFLSHGSCDSSIETTEVCDDKADTNSAKSLELESESESKPECKSLEMAVDERIQSPLLSDSNVSNDNEDIYIARMKKREERNAARNEQNRQRVNCKHCHKEFARSYVKFHELVHTGEKKYKCHTCNKSYVNPCHYYAHVHNVHKKGHPFLCNQCGRGFKRGWVLNHHIRVQHNNERPYVCKTCGKTFKYDTILKHHETSHSDERPFQCEKCPKRFSLKKFLKQHSVTHSEVRPFACDFCDKRFTQRHCLRSHQAKTCEGLLRRAENE